MAARSIGSGTLSFGLVSIPVRFYVATHSERLSFNMLHEPCKTRIKQQLYCPTHEKVVDRNEIVKGFEFAKGQYVTITDEELKALEAEANRAIDIHEFVPLDKVDPLYFEDAHYLGPERGAEKAYKLLSEAMKETDRVAVAQFVSHGKEHIGVIRPLTGDGGLVLHSMHYADEVRDFKDVPMDAHPKIRDNEINLARKLIEQLSNDAFEPEKYKDDYRERVQAVIEQKVAGEEIAISEAPRERAQVIDLMEALKQSLAADRGGKKAGKGKAAEEGEARRPAASTRRREPARTQKRARKK
jgi:DNA end-binding protein Ku